MDIVQLEHFLAVASERTFTRAAERVFRTQPALSQSIRKLEESVGATLFARDANDVSLTEAGKILAGYAHKMLHLRDEATRAIAQLQNLESGTLSIAAHESAAIYLLPYALLAFADLFPDVKMSVQGGKLDDIPAKVLDRQVQIGFVKDPPAFRELECVNVHTDEMVLIASPRHPMANRASLSIQDLENVPFVVHHLCSSTQKVVRLLFRTHGVRCRIVAELWSFENLKSFVMRDVGMAIVPRITAMQELCNKTLVEIPLSELKVSRSTLMIFRRDYISNAAGQLIEIMRKRQIFPSVAADCA